MRTGMTGSWRRTRTLLLVAVVLAALAYAWWGSQSELTASERVTARVERIKETADGGPLLLEAALADGRTLWVVIPRDGLRPEAGKRVPLIRERYADGTVRYRFDRAGWGASGAPSGAG